MGSPAGEGKPPFRSTAPTRKRLGDRGRGLLSHFGWQSGLGILVANLGYSLVFRRELGRFQGSFLARSLKDEIRRNHIPRDLMESMFERVVPEVDREFQGLEQLRALIGREVDEVRVRLEAEYIEEVSGRGIDIELARAAFHGRFEEVTLGRIRRGFPRILPEEEQVEFVDPAWDQREEPVPAWVMAVHVGFLAWTVLDAHHAPLFVAGMLFFLGFSVVARRTRTALI